MESEEKPLIVQSDRTLLLNVHSSKADECRNSIIVFSELIKAPEHIHTYYISDLSIWNANSVGIFADKIISVLNRWSKFTVPDNIIQFISQMSERFGSIQLLANSIPLENNTLLEYNNANDMSSFTDNLAIQNTVNENTANDYINRKLLLKIKDDTIATIIKSNKKIMDLLEYTEDPLLFSLKKINRGALKVALINLGYPVDDRIPLDKGDELNISLNINLRDYQKDAVNAVLGDFSPGTGYGTLVMPCGSGKTIVGLGIMEKLKTSTLILCPNIIACRQWIREILDKTNITSKQIGEYSGEKKQICEITVCTYQVLTHKVTVNDEEVFKNMNALLSHNFGLVIYDEVHVLPAPVFKISAELQSVYHIGLTATLIREDNKEKNVFSLVGPKKYDIPWVELAHNGYIAKANCIEIKISLPDDINLKYAIADKKLKYKLASTNPEKISIVKSLLEKHYGESILIIGQYLDQLQEVKKIFNFPLITGSTPNTSRDLLYNKFRNKEEKVLIVSKVANFAIDLPDASVAIQISGTFGSRQEEAQRLGRILRPKDYPSFFYTIVTKYSVEEEFSANRQKFLLEQGYTYQIKEF